MEPERKIEKMLRAYAKKRRAQAGDPPALHPAARRLLHGEIARRTPKPVAEEESLSLWEFFRQQWAFLLCFTLVIFFGVAMFLPALSSAKKKAQSASALNNLKQIGLVAQMSAEENHGQLPASLDALTNRLGTDKILTDPQSGQPFIYAVGGENLDALPGNAVLAYSPANNKNNHAVLFADGSVTMVSATRFSGMTNRQLSELALAKKAARNIGDLAGNYSVTSAPVYAGQLAAHDAVDRDSATNSALLGFAAASVLSPATAFQNSLAATNATVLLTHFQVQQNGHALRVVDADGSIYDGMLQPEREDLPAKTGSLASPPGLDRTKLEKGDFHQDGLRLVQNYSFRVAGTNQTLNQSVVFTGNLLTIANATTNAPPLLNRITGSVIMAGTNRIEINAVPQSH